MKKVFVLTREGFPLTETDFVTTKTSVVTAETGFVPTGTSPVTNCAKTFSTAKIFSFVKVKASEK